MDKAGLKQVVAVAVTLAGTGLLTGAGVLAGSASAAPPNAHEPEGFAHSHHVHTGDGGCVDIDSVLFHLDSRGLHRGANSSDVGHGPWHGTCDNRLYPGGPLTSSFGIPPHH